MQPEHMLDTLRKHRIVAVMRGDFPAEKAVATCQALLDGGVHIVEMTHNSPHWREALPAVLQAFGDRLIVGMGTVLNRAHTQEAIDYGAQFLVAPSFDPESVSTAHAAGLLMAPGVTTPTEAVRAAAMGARLLKFFPAGPLGVDYFRTMRGPLDDLNFICNGNMSVDNIEGFLRAGAVACGMGTLSGKGDRSPEDIRAITRQAVEIVAALNAETAGA